MAERVTGAAQRRRSRLLREFTGTTLSGDGSPPQCTARGVFVVEESEGEVEHEKNDALRGQSPPPLGVRLAPLSEVVGAQRSGASCSAGTCLCLCRQRSTGKFDVSARRFEDIISSEMIPYSMQMLGSTPDTIHSAVAGGFHPVSTLNFKHFLREGGPWIVRFHFFFAREGGPRILAVRTRKNLESLRAPGTCIHSFGVWVACGV